MRASLLVAFVLCWTTLAQAGDIILAWNEDLEWQPRIPNYLLYVTTLNAGAPRQEPRWLSPLSKAECATFPLERVTVETQCARICLEPGFYSLQLTAVAQGVSSVKSLPVLDLDLRSTTPCAGPPPPPPVARPPSSLDPTVPVVIGGAAATYATLLAREAVTPPLEALVNKGCVTWRLLGPCFCGPQQPCVSVEYWEPG